MKTLLSTAAMAALLVSGVALADGSGMKGQGMKGQHMSSPHADMKTEMQARMHDDDDERHPGKRYDEEHAGKGKHERHSTSESDRLGRGYDDDDDRGSHYKNRMDRDRS